MTFLGIGPWAVVGVVAAMAAALFALHHLRVRPAVQRVPTLLFWRRAIEESTARHLFARFRHPRTWAMLVALAGAIVLALADPTTGDGARRHRVLVVDTSDATRATRDGSPAIDAVRDAACAWLDDLPLGDRVALVASSRVVAGFDVPRPAVRDRLDTLVAGGASVARSVDVARALANGRGRSDVTVFAVSGAPADTDDVAWVAMRTDRGARALGAVEFVDALRVRVDAFAADDARRLVVRADARDAISVDVPACAGPGSAWVTVPGVPADGRDVVVALEPADATPHDDVVRYRLPDHRARALDVDASLGAVQWLVDADPRLVPANEGAAALAVRADGGGGSIAAGTRMRVAARPLGDAAATHRLPRLERDVTALGDGPGDACLTAGDAVLARLDRTATPPVLVLAADLFADDGIDGARVLRRAAVAAWLARTLHDAAGVVDGAIVARAGDDTATVLATDARGRAVPRPIPVAAADAAPVAIGDARVAFVGAALAPAVVQDGSAPPVSGGGFRPWEWLALVALALAAVDAALHLRRRIP